MHVRPLLFALFLAGAAGCGVGDASGPGGGDGDGDGTGDGDGDGSGGGPQPDAIPALGILCASVYTVTGDVEHAVLPGESCDGTGTWTVAISDPTPDEDYQGCGEAPASETFSFSVTKANDVYSVTDNDDPERVWTVQVRDKGGSCSATFVHDLGGGAEWALVPSENGPDGPLDGTARYEVRE